MSPLVVHDLGVGEMVDGGMVAKIRHIRKNLLKSLGEFNGMYECTLRKVGKELCNGGNL